uniref:Putative secreted mucin n=1 Tax=Ixodes ricinus TaxID=34613 RepID=A0A090XBA9_IXORI
MNTARARWTTKPSVRMTWRSLTCRWSTFQNARWRAGMSSTAATSWGLRQTSSTTTRTASSMLSPAPGAGRPCFGATSSCTAGRAATQLHRTSLFPPVNPPPVN